MTSRGLLTLVAAAVLVLGAGLWLADRQASPAGDAAEGALYPGLERELDAIERVRIFKAGDERGVELERGEAGWIVTGRQGYRADAAKLRELVVALAEARRYEEKTSNPDQYAALGVEDVSRENAQGVRVELVGSSVPVNLIVGKPGLGTSTHYVRPAGEATSWLIDRRLEAPIAPEAWLDKEIVDIPAERVQSATVTVAGDKSYTAAKGSRDDANFDVEGLPKGKSMRSTSAASGFATALSDLSLSDVQPASAFGSEPPADRATFRTFDGLVVELQGWKREDKRFVALRASFEAAPDAEAEAKTLTRRTAGWVYEIPEYRYASLFKPMEDLL